MAKPPHRDLILIVICLLIVATVGAWLVGLMVYPFGILVLCAAFFARLLQLSAGHRDS